MGLKGVRLRRIVWNFIVIGLVIRFQHQFFSGDEIKKNKLGGECGTYGGQERRNLGLEGFLLLLEQWPGREADDWTPPRDEMEL